MQFSPKVKLTLVNSILLGQISKSAIIIVGRNNKHHRVLKGMLDGSHVPGIRKNIYNRAYLSIRQYTWGVSIKNKHQNNNSQKLQNWWDNRSLRCRSIWIVPYWYTKMQFLLWVNSFKLERVKSKYTCIW